MILKSIVEVPQTIDEAVNKLLVILTDKERELVKGLPEDELFLLYFGLGKGIRNAFRLHEPENKLLAACDTIHPDDASDVII